MKRYSQKTDHKESRLSPGLARGNALGVIKMFDEKDIICRYTSKEAEEDGILVNVSNLKVANWEINYATSNLLSKGYMTDGKINLPAIADLLYQANKMLDTDYDCDFNADEIELPNGEKQTIYVCRNETGFYTMMLPEDY